MICNNQVSARNQFDFDSFNLYIASALSDQALKDFKEVSASVKNNIFWKGKRAQNKYESAYKRSRPYLHKLFRDDVPDFVFLIPYLESGWRATKGRKKSDYGYWQMVTEVVAEIKTLEHASAALKKMHPDKIRSNLLLSTEAAIIHLKRYYFYFRHVANFAEADAWLFAVTSYNWGAGNVKRTLLKMQKEMPAKNKSAPDFASFYHYLYTLSNKHPKDKSMRVALEYLPNLWNIALLIQAYQKKHPVKKRNKKHAKKTVLSSLKKL